MTTERQDERQPYDRQTRANDNRTPCIAREPHDMGVAVWSMRVRLKHGRWLKNWALYNPMKTNAQVWRPADVCQRLLAHLLMLSKTTRSRRRCSISSRAACYKPGKEPAVQTRFPARCTSLSTAHTHSHLVTKQITLSLSKS